MPIPMTERQKIQAALMSGRMNPDYAQSLIHQLQNTDDKFAIQMSAGERMSPNEQAPSGMAASGFAPVDTGSTPPIASGTVEGRQAGVDAQRKIAEGLRGRGAPKGRTAGPYDVYYGPNIGETLAHAGEQLMGGYMAGQAAEEEADIDVQRGLEKAAAKAQEEARYGDTRSDAAITQGQGQARIDETARSNKVGETTAAGTLAVSEGNLAEKVAAGEFTRSKPQLTTLSENQILVEDATGETVAKGILKAYKPTAAQEKAANKSLEQATGNRKILSQLFKVRQALDDGALTGPLDEMIFSFREPTKRLEAAKDQLALYEISNYTFGSLSEAEGKWLKDVVVPTGLDEEDLLVWIDNKVEGITRAMQMEEYMAEKAAAGEEPSEEFINEYLYKDDFDWGQPKKKEDE